MPRLTKNEIHGDGINCTYRRESFSSCTAFWSVTDWHNVCTNQTHKLLQFIYDVEQSTFRTVHDTGANWNGLYLWNRVRKFAGLSKLTWNDLDAYCGTCECYHVNPHVRVPCQYDRKEYRQFYNLPYEDLL